MTNEVLVAPDKYISVYPNTNNVYLWHAQTFNTPANPIGDSEFGVVFTGSVTDHVSLVAARIAGSSMVIPAGSNQVTYTTYADINDLSGTSTTGVVYIGRIAVNGVTEKDAYWRSVVGHEMGHQMAIRMWGTWIYPYDVNESPLDRCNCNAVEVVGDRQHCMNSREGIGAARSEAWGHAFSTSLVNLTSDSTAPFGYYKRVYDPNYQRPNCNDPNDPWCHTRVPPLTVDATLNFNWMENNCFLANSGTEVDWMSFFYQLDNKTANSWTIGNFWNVFQTECPPPNSSCPVSWISLQNAANSFFPPGSTKAGYLTTAGDLNGVNH